MGNIMSDGFQMTKVMNTSAQLLLQKISARYQFQLLHLRRIHQTERNSRYGDVKLEYSLFSVGHHRDQYYDLY